MTRVIYAALASLLLSPYVIGSEEERFFSVSTEKVCLIKIDINEVECEGHGPFEADKNIGLIVAKGKWCIKDEISGTCSMENDVVYEDVNLLMLRKNFGSRQGISSVMNIYKRNNSFIWNESHLDQSGQKSVQYVTYGTFN